MTNTPNMFIDNPFSCLCIEQVNVITAHFYDSIIYYAFMIRDLARSPASSFSGTALSLLKQRYNFTSPINGLVTMTVDGDRQSAYIIKNFNNDSGQFEVLYSRDKAVHLRLSHASVSPINRSDVTSL